jgi:PAS domain-containing protein
MLPIMDETFDALPSRAARRVSPRWHTSPASTWPSPALEARQPHRALIPRCGYPRQCREQHTNASCELGLLRRAGMTTGAAWDRQGTAPAPVTGAVTQRIVATGAQAESTSQRDDPETFNPSTGRRTVHMPHVRAALQSIDQPAFAADPAGHVCLINDAFSDLFSVDPADDLDKAWQACLGDDGWPRWLQGACIAPHPSWPAG